MEVKKQKILIVGSTGFLGFNVTKRLLKKYEIFSITKNTKVKKKNRKLNKVKYFFFDISNRKNFNKYKSKIPQIDYVINFGGEIVHNKKNVVNKTHYVGAKNLMKFFLKKKIKLFIQIGSSMEYGQSCSPQKEDIKCKPISFYGKAKLNATLYAQRIYRRNKFPVIILRLYQVYGPYQNDRRLIPFVFKNCLAKKSFPCSSGIQKRDFLYINDFVNCIEVILAKKKHKLGEIYNVGFGNSLFIKDVIQKIVSIAKGGYPKYGLIKLRQEETNNTFPNIMKVTNHYKWKPKTNLNQGLKKTFEYYKLKKE